MHARLARYSFTGDAQELTQKAEEGVVPILESLPGFKAYTIIESDGEIFSFSAWESSEQADAANVAIGDWVAENLADHLTMVESRFGEVRLSTTLGITSAAGARA